MSASAPHDHDRVQRWASILVGGAVVALVGWVTIEQSSAPRRPRDAGAADVASDPSAADASAAASGEDASLPSLHALGDLDADVSTLSFSFGDSGLPGSAPRHVKVGVVLVQWQGAEGAGTNTRPKKDALAKAQELAQQAKADFRRAVSQGDPGSAEDIGRIPRGTLDPRTEVTLFSLAPGDVSDVVETPRGYWIVKRIE